MYVVYLVTVMHVHILYMHMHMYMHACMVIINCTVMTSLLFTHWNSCSYEPQMHLCAGDVVQCGFSSAITSI